MLRMCWCHFSSSVFTGLQSTRSDSLVQEAEKYSATTQYHFVSTEHNTTILYVTKVYLKLRQVLYNWSLMQAFQTL